MLRLERVTKYYPGNPVAAIDGIDLTVNSGEVVGLVGRNGAGKTTLIRVSAGVSLPTTGSVLIDGLDLARQKIDASAHVGWVPEAFPFDPSARALKLLTYFAGLHGITGEAGQRRARELLEQFGLTRDQDRRIRSFSQGMKRRLSIAAAMVGGPSTLLLDEVQNGLDPEGISQVREWMRELRSRGVAVLLSSHLLAELESVADRVAFLNRGSITRVVDRADIKVGTRVRIEIRIENPDDGTVPVLQRHGEVRATGKSFIVSGPTLDPADLNSELARHGYHVSKLLRLEGSLEEYYLQTVVRCD